MKNSKLTDLKREHRKLFKKIDKLQENISIEVWKTKVIPFCNKYKLRFISGMGTYVFCNKDVTFTDKNDFLINKYGFKCANEFLKVCNIIEKTIGENKTALYEYMKDYDATVLDF